MDLTYKWTQHWSDVVIFCLIDGRDVMNKALSKYLYDMFTLLVSYFELSHWSDVGEHYAGDMEFNAVKVS